MSHTWTPPRLSSSHGGGVISTSIAIAVILTTVMVIAQLGIVGLEFLHLQAIADNAASTATLSSQGGHGPAVSAADATITRLWSMSLGVAQFSWTTTSNSMSLTLTALLPTSSDPVLHLLGVTTLTVHAKGALETPAVATP